MEKTHEYTNGEVTVLWKPSLCIHSANCVHGLPSVFKPKEKPWINLENSDSETIINTVKACPSGALSYVMNALGTSNIDQEMKNENTKIQVMKDGPLLVMGTMKITHEDGSEELKEKRAAFCRCGQSGNQPFCDGSHKTA